MRFRPLHEDIGVEVLDFDVQRPASPEDVARLRSALDEHQLLLFRGGERLTHAQQIEITGWFGPPSDNGGGELCVYLDNDEPAGSARLPFHSDFTFTEFPAKVLSLQGVEVPPGGTSTVFASGASSWTRLSDDQRDMLSEMTVRHRELTILGRYDLPEFIADQPVRKLHPRTGRPILFVTELHAERINELGPYPSRELLGRLFEILYDPAHLYTHDWRLNDVIIWDNWSLQHSRPEVAERSAGKRVVQRVAINDVGYPELVERARAQQARRQAALVAC